MQIRDVEYDKYLIQQIADLHEQLPSLHPQHQMAREDQQQRPVAIDKPGPHHPTDCQKELEMDGHTLRKAPSNIICHAIEWSPKGKRQLGRPKTTWRRSCEQELKTCDLSWEEAKNIAQN